MTSSFNVSSIRCKTLLTAAICSLLLPACFGQTAVVEKASDALVLTPLGMSVGGRVLIQSDHTHQSFGAKKYIYQWPGTYFAASFRGKETYFLVGEGRQILHVIVDHQQPLVLSKVEAGTYRISGLAAGRHNVRVEVVTESQGGPDSFGGFALTPSARPLPAPHLARQIEFIGDSHTVGYGNTSATRSCSPDQIWATTDSSQAFGPLTAKHYGADYQINAISGHGIVRNYNGSPGDPVPVAYPYVLFDKKDRYVDPSWDPQIIVLALGTNDFSTPLNSGEKWASRDQLHADYETTYVQFLKALRALHPKAFFILWATDGANGEIQAEVQKVIQKLQADGDARVAFIPVNGLSMTACDWHPSIADHKTISDLLNDYIDEHPQLWQGRAANAARKQ